MRKKMNLLPFAVFAFLLVLGGLLLADWRLGGEGGEPPCGALREISPVQATGKFNAHNEGFIYIGDVFDFELRVVYDAERVEVKERSLRNFNLSPYRAISQSDISTKDYANCSEKRITFRVQALDVYPGALRHRNEVSYIDSGGVERRPRVEYIKDGVLGSRFPLYEEPLVAPLTDGKVRALPAIEKKHLLPAQEPRDAGFRDISRFALGAGLILMLALWVLAPFVAEKVRRPQRGEQGEDIAASFPELFGESDVHERLVAAYFRLEKEIDESLRARVGEVFSASLTQDQEKALILELRKHVEESRAAPRGSAAEGKGRNEDD